eukprot:TCONS_00027325-protein
MSTQMNTFLYVSIISMMMMVVGVKSCQLMTFNAPIEKDNCISSGNVTFNYCGGKCSSETTYHTSYPHYTKKCQRCKIAQASVVDFICWTRGTRSYKIETINSAVKCQCRNA